jgi:hypothetical protein
MARTRFFHDTDAGETFELLAGTITLDGLSARKAANYSGMCGDGVRRQATRMIEMKRNPTRHECDSRCRYASGKVMRCECSCGGRNHGKGR